MDCNSFITLYNILEEKYIVKDGREIKIEEQVAIFLLAIGHNERNCACQNTFQHSRQTISKYVNLVLRAICQLVKEYISRSNDDTPSKICLSPRFYSYFKKRNSFTKCIGCSWIRHVIPLCFGGWVMQCDRFKRKSYLDNGGYPNIRGLLTPYQSHRYHLSEFNTLGA
ncbi:hypothetical protein EJ110_NYTH16656 [Nymphaea thermarum]|nr:hypothetical protein EJ110_NYTH16656 [Nymphaea thermarum]